MSFIVPGKVLCVLLRCQHCTITRASRAYYSTICFWGNVRQTWAAGRIVFRSFRMTTKVDPNAMAGSGSGDGVASPKIPEHSKSRLSRRGRIGSFLAVAVVLYIGVAIYQTCVKPLPPGLSLAGEPHPVASSDVEFLYDLTATKGEKPVVEQRIFDRVLRLIHEAQDFILVDAFLFNEDLGKNLTVHRKVCHEITEALLEAKRNCPGMHMVVITDPINEFYGSSVPPHLRILRQAGIPVIVTDLCRLRDSNPAYSALWRIGVQWFGNAEGGILTHPWAKNRRVNVRSWLALLNFKANHRKLVVADAPKPGGGRQMVSMVMSANPHDDSSAHSNIGLSVRNGIWRELLQGEQAILSFSGSGLDLGAWLPAYAHQSVRTNSSSHHGLAEMEVVTEAKIRDRLLLVLEAVGKGDTIDLAMFYLSHRRVITALVNAAARGAAVRVLLDPNRDAFGYRKNGIPNRPVAAELMQRTGGKILVRWYDTRGEQFHTKMVLVSRGDKSTLFVGSANLTGRNIGDFNLETDVVLTGPSDFPAVQDSRNYFEQVWTNEDLDCSLPYAAYADPSRLRYWLYRFQEWSGVCTF
jgi:phosphatidylserine/phosphatidylglycerophosphate/cardiolipin synthase-like enzyme